MVILRDLCEVVFLCSWGAFLRKLSMEDKGRDIRASHSGLLPFVSSCDARIGLAEEIDRLLRCQMEASPGRVTPR